ncbi:hypothetical protein I552_4278 [Mycobacterium xenopi 3993]|nr:hypothetical protein I552_4278 [Mycobacterium xenopi 3993]
MLTAITHVAFICYVVVGGFIALRWRRTLWLHIAAVLWARPAWWAMWAVL